MSVYPFVDVYTDPVPTGRVKLSSSIPFTPKYIEDNVTRFSTPAQAYASRVRGRQLLLASPAHESHEKKERKKKATKNYLRTMKTSGGAKGSRETAGKEAWNLTDATFSALLPLHQLWLGYVSELLMLAPAPTTSVNHVEGNVMPSATLAKLVKADLHGSMIRVQQSKNPCLVGISGIVLHETENAFKVVTKTDQLKLIPKLNSVFQLAIPLNSTFHAQPFATPPNPTQNLLASPTPPNLIWDIPHIEVHLYGDQFRFRPTERANRKFKHKETVEL